MNLDFLLVAGVFAAAWCGHTPRSKAYADEIEQALADSQTTRTAASIDMGLGPDGTKLSRQLAGRDILNGWRLEELPDAFQIALLKRKGARFGLTVIDAAERSLILGFVGAGVKRMARVFPKLASERRSA